MNKLIVRSLLALVVLSPSLSQARVWKPGQTTMFLEIENGSDPHDNAALDPIMGHQRAPFLKLPDAISQDVAVLNTISTGVPREEELVRLLKLTDEEFAEEAKHLAEVFQNYVTAENETQKQKAAWTVINQNRDQKIHMQFQLKTRYSVMDFEVSTSWGEGSDRRVNCQAGFRQHIDLELVRISFPNSERLTMAAQGAVGTTFTHRYDELLGRNLLQQKIDLSKEQYVAFEKECKAQKDKFLP